MWGNRSFSSKKTTSPKSRFNSTLPAFVISPISTRQRQSDDLNQSMQTSVLSAAGPPLSSPFMPQIKRALGLEPDHKRSYGGIQRRHSFHTPGFQTSNGLPHVVLNKSRQLPLTERNSTMLKRSSTVKIAPPTPGKIASPSLYQMRNSSLIQEDRNTPDTHAVVTALKERRKRSITAHEETQEFPVQHAKRRRQESQQSNASTSSMPSMPDNLPDLTNRDFSIRIETPNVQRPSRPSQNEMPGGWDPNSSLNSTRLETRNNSILSSLSSSRRFAMSKRRAELSQVESENQSMKAQKRDPPKLSHFDSSHHTPVTLTRGPINMNSVSSLPLTNGHTDVSIPEGKTADSTPNTDQPVVDKPATLKQLPSLKKKTSLYAGLSQNSSFRKAQYANVVATLDDYDQDLVAENRRVQQMLNDVDTSFAEPEKPEDGKPLSGTTTTTSTNLSVQSASLNTTKSTVTVVSAPSTSVSLTSLVGSSAETSLPAVPKSPVQEVGDSSTAKAVSTATPVTSSNQNLSALLANSNSAPLTSSAVLPALSTPVNSGTSSAPSSTVPSSAVTSSSAGNFSFGTSLSSTNSGKGASLQVTNSAGPSSIGGFNFNATSTVSSAPSSTNTGLNVGGNLASTAASVGLGLNNAATVTAASVNPAPGGFSFGATAGPTSTANTGVGLGLVSSTNVTKPLTGLVPAQQTPAAGISFGTSTTSSSGTQSGVSSQQPGGFNFGASAKTSNPAPSGFGLSTAGTTQGVSNNSGFSFGGAAVSAPAQTSSGLSGFGTTASTNSTPGGFTFNTASTSAGPVQSTGGFNFTPASTTAAPAPGGFTFNAAPAAPSTTAATQSTGGFSFGGGGGGQSSSGTASGFNTVNTTTASSTAASFGGFSQPPATQAAAGGFNFSAVPKNSAPGTGVTFGSTATSSNLFAGAAPTAASTPFTFNTGTASTAPSATTPFAFNAGVTKTTASTPFTFNAGATTTATSANTGFSFGQTTSSTAGSSGAFSFGGSNSATQGLAFGSSNTTPAFGSTNQAPAFGSANQTPVFGSANPTPAFGSANQPPAYGSTNQTPAFGSANQPPAYGSTNQTPAFGSTNQTPAFGSTTAQPTAFGAPTFGASTQNAASSNSMFGAPATTNQSSSSVFGASANSNAPVFGAGPNTATGFGKSHSMPTFGSNTSGTAGTGAFTFEGQTAPNVNPFAQGGPTTPAKQTGSMFGAVNTNSTPQNQTGAMFAFGQNNNDTTKKGFDFSSSAGGGGAAPTTGGFNFASAASLTPVFNFAAAASTPNAGGVGFGTPSGQASFSVGTGDASRPPRPIAKGRRRVPRR